jgi:zinc transporter ZupT
MDCFSMFLSRLSETFMPLKWLLVSSLGAGVTPVGVAAAATVCRITSCLVSSLFCQLIEVY